MSTLIFNVNDWPAGFQLKYIPRIGHKVVPARKAGESYASIVVEDAHESRVRVAPPRAPFEHLRQLVAVVAAAAVRERRSDILHDVVAIRIYLGCGHTPVDTPLTDVGPPHLDGGAQHLGAARHGSWTRRR